ncbi:MAG: bifunctional ADP-dependent NAD(P)H-hydrate dehydratase/NAD(P)H-hydrate epimerase [Candidatus Altiarchaeales archaeon HGW-Altiarchaeales-1]|nr:MAG: bifunctional ADP-dependent NAD(P)H-hydrate dehydratase/NAD(P)H-hydrate epimerase [Candidatus Altiarchaeales archaeon HGW-Altiarchaeales-1]
MDLEKETKRTDLNAKFFGIDTLLLMENAGKCVAEECKNFDKILIFCGTGNNGGDGLCAARHLLAEGKEILIQSLKGNRTYENQKNFDILKNFADIKVIRDSSEIEKLKEEILKFNPDVIVDALIGVGSKGKLREPTKSLINLANELHCYKIAVDIPTGDDEIKFNADKVISFEIGKTNDAIIKSIGIPKKIERMCGVGDFLTALKEYKGDEHKGYFGKTLVIGGSRDYIGAPYLTAKASQKFNDLTYIATPKFVQRRIFDPTLIFLPCEDEEYLQNLVADYAKFDCIAIGNGISLKASKELISNVVEKSKKVVIDAEALKLINPEILNKHCIITPHLGEFKALFGVDLYNENTENKAKVVQNFAEKYNTTIVLKGKTDIVAIHERTKFNEKDCIRLTVGGTGDVLAGIIAGIYAQNDEPFESVCAGTFLNGLAGEILFKKNENFDAIQLVDAIPEAIKFCLNF